MSSLLPKEIIEDILNSTGAYGDGKVARVLKGDFKHFDFQVKKRSEFKLGVFEDGLDKFKELIESDWKLNYLPEFVLRRENAQLTELSRYTFRSQSVCCQYKSNIVADSFFIYFGRDSFFGLLNDYLGGAKLNSAKDAAQFTDIEMIFLKQVVERFEGFVSEAFSYLDKLDLKLVKVGLGESDQKREFSAKHLLCEYIFTVLGKDYKVALAMPQSFLVHLKEKQERENSVESLKPDPSWQSVVTKAFLTTSVELVANLGNLQVPFDKSLNLKPGDTFEWAKENTKITLYQDGKPRVIGTIGVVGENFAVRVDEMKN